MSVTEPRSGLGLVHSWGLGTNNWHTEMDANLKKLGLFGVHCCVLDKDLTTPPGSPSNGDAYIVAATATGAWTGHEKHIAIWDTSLTTPAWTFGTPREGWLCYVTDEAVLYVYHSAAWVTGGTEANTLANGKTGATTAAGARTSLQTGPAGAFGAVPAFVANAASIAPGTDKYSIYNIEAARTIAAASALTITTTDTPVVGNKVIACYALTLGYAISVVNGGPLAGTIATFPASLTKPLGAVVYWDGTNYKFNGYVELLP